MADRKIKDRAEVDQELQYSAITDIIRSNGGEIPRSAEEWIRVLKRDGSEIGTSIVAFSDAPGHTNLGTPASRISNTNITSSHMAGKGGPRLIIGVTGDPTTANSTTKVGRFFIGIIYHQDGSREVEFISRNREPERNGAYDYGIIADFGKKTARLEMPPRTNCTSCHQGPQDHENPVFPEAPWSNTHANPYITHALIETLFSDDPKVIKKLHEMTERAITEKSSPSDFERDLKREFGERGNTKPLLLDGVHVVKDGLISDTFSLDQTIRGTGFVNELRNFVDGIPSADTRNKWTAAQIKVALLADIRNDPGNGANGVGNNEGLKRLKANAEKFHNQANALLSPELIALRNDGGTLITANGSIRNYNQATGQHVSGLQLPNEPINPYDILLIQQHNEKRSRKNPQYPDEFRPTNPKTFLTRENGLDPRESFLVGVVNPIARTVLSSIVGISNADQRFFIGKIRELANEAPVPKTLIDQKMAEWDASDKEMQKLDDRIDAREIQAHPEKADQIRRDRIASKNREKDDEPAKHAFRMERIKREWQFDVFFSTADHLLTSGRIDALCVNGKAPSRDVLMQALAEELVTHSKEKYGFPLTIDKEEYTDKFAPIPPLRKKISPEATQPVGMVDRSDMRSCMPCHTGPNPVGGELPVNENEFKTLRRDDPEEATRIHSEIERRAGKDMPPKSSFDKDLSNEEVAAQRAGIRADVLKYMASIDPQGNKTHAASPSPDPTKAEPKMTAGSPATKVTIVGGGTIGVNSAGAAVIRAQGNVQPPKVAPPLPVQGTGPVKPQRPLAAIPRVQQTPIAQTPPR